MDLAAAGNIKPKLFRVLEAKDWQEAHALIENRAVKGKILLAFS